MKRYLSKQVLSDLRRKMVFVGGPRQVGKTTLAKQLLGKKRGYFNWDVAEDRDALLRGELPPTGLWVFDEIHKYRSWRNYLKGLYDNRRKQQRILVTGSARLDYYRFSGDSLQGRYHYLRLHPLSFAEIGGRSRSDLDALLRFGGFPEPFLAASETEAKRWSREYRTRLLREDLVSLEQTQDLGNLELLMIRLPELVGSPLSINALQEDLQISHKTIAKWLAILERLYGIFRVSPFGHPKIRAAKKLQKHYHFDWSVVHEPGYRFENLVGSHLLKWVHSEEDTKGDDIELRFFRDLERREVDFVVVRDRKPELFVECKWNDAPVNPALHYARHRFSEAEMWQVSATGRKDYVTKDGIRVAPATEFLKRLV